MPNISRFAQWYTSDAKKIAEMNCEGMHTKSELTLAKLPSANKYVKNVLYIYFATHSSIFAYIK